MPTHINANAEVIKRRRLVVKLMMEGYAKWQIVQTLGINASTLRQDIIWINKYWMRRDRKRLGQIRHLRVKQIENVMATAAAAFEKSKEDKTPCLTCSGRGYLSGNVMNRCDVCGGTGIKIIGDLPGDPTWLRIMKDCLAEISRIEGIHREKKKPEKQKKEQDELAAAIVDQRLKQITDDQVIAVRVAMEQALRKQLESSVIVESEPVDPDDWKEEVAIPEPTGEKKEAS